MRRKILKWLLVGTALFVGAPAYGQDVHIMWRCGTTGFAQFCQVEAANPLPVTGTFTPSGSSPEFTPVAPATATATKGVLNGCQYDSTQKTLTDGQQSATSCSPRGAFFVATGADSFTIANTSFAATQATAASLNATVVGTGTFVVQAAQSGTWTVQPGNTANTTAWLFALTATPTVAAGNGVISAPSSEALAAIAHSTSVTAAESCRVLKASPGNVYSLRVSIAATSGYVMVFDATSAPTDGAVTTLAIPAVRVVSDGTSGWYADDFNPPLRNATGITVCFSSTGPFSKTASATAAISGQVQ